MLLYARVNETNSWTPADQAKDKSSIPKQLVKEAVIESEARTTNNNKILTFNGLEPGRIVLPPPKE